MPALPAAGTLRVPVEAAVVARATTPVVLAAVTIPAAEPALVSPLRVRDVPVPTVPGVAAPTLVATPIAPPVAAPVAAFVAMPAVAVLVGAAVPRVSASEAIAGTDPVCAKGGACGGACGVRDGGTRLRPRRSAARVGRVRTPMPLRIRVRLAAPGFSARSAVAVPAASPSSSSSAPLVLGPAVVVPPGITVAPTRALSAAIAGFASGPVHSTVTDLARLRGWSTSQPRFTAMW